MDFLKLIADKFQIKGEILNILPHGNGLINKTFKIITNKRNYLLQEINNHVFNDIDKVMHNIENVTKHILSKNKKTLEIIKTKENKLFIKFEDRYYRMYKFIEGSKPFVHPISNDTLKLVSFYYGEFVSLLSDFDSLTLYEIIPNFHNTVDRFNKFKIALKEDKFLRASKCKEEIDYLLSNEKYASIIVTGLENKTIPYRVCHNDTKVDNILIDDRNNLLAVIDLDTLMPGSLLYDFGDLCRSSLANVKEDASSKELVINLEAFNSLVEGFYNASKNIITKSEIDLLHLCPFIITYELALRFLTDYLSGDVYFKSKYEEHNLDRTKNQIALCKAIFKNLDLMKNIVNNICNY